MTLIELELEDPEHSPVWVNVEDITRLAASNFGGTSVTLRDGVTLDTVERLDVFIQRLKMSLGVVLVNRL